MTTRTLFTLLSLLSVALAQAQPQSQGWIVKFKSDRVDPTKRQNWITNQLNNAELPPLSVEDASTLKVWAQRRCRLWDLSAHALIFTQTGWNTTVFDGFSGAFTASAVQVFRDHEDVAWLEPGTLPEMATMPTGLTMG